VIDQAALVAALTDKTHCRRPVIDVFEKEPPSAGRVTGCPKVVLTRISVATHRVRTSRCRIV